MSESRDANDPRDAMRGMRKEARAEFEREEAGDTGGQEHATGADREGAPAARRPEEQAAEPARQADASSDAGALRVPRQAPIDDAGGVAPGPPGGEPRRG